MIFSSLPFVSLVDAQGSALVILAVERAHSGLAFGFVRHFDEREAAGSAGEAISNDADTRDRAVLAEQVTQALLGRLETQITHVDTEHEEVLPSWEPANGHERTEQANPNKKKIDTIDGPDHRPSPHPPADPGKCSRTILLHIDVDLYHAGFKSPPTSSPPSTPPEIRRTNRSQQSTRYPAAGQLRRSTDS